MTKNNSCECPFLLACLLVSLQAVANDEDLANERFVEPGKAIEAHWQIDCGQTSAAVSTLLATLADQRELDCGLFNAAMRQDELSNLLDSLQKCGFIYNTKGSRRFQPCPDYAVAHRGLDSATDACRPTTGESTSRLELLQQAQAALDCSQAR